MAFTWLALPFLAPQAGAFVQRPFERKMLQKVYPLGMLARLPALCARFHPRARRARWE